MVLLSLSHRFNKAVGPVLLRYGLSARNALGTQPISDNPALDYLLLIRLGQKLVSLEVEEEADQILRKARQEKSAFDRWSEDKFDGIFGKGEPEEYYTQKEIEEMNPRLQAFESYMRPILVPNERWSDIMRWQMNIRFLHWARNEFLAAKYGLDLKEALEAYPKLRSGPQVLESKAKRKLKFVLGDKDSAGEKEWLQSTPSAHLVQTAFQMQSWSRKKDNDAAWKRMIQITYGLDGEVIPLPGSDKKIAKVNPETDVSHLSVEDILEVTGTGVSSSGTFNLFCERYDIYQLWTRDYIDGLAAYLLHRSQRHSGDTLVLEVGAGDGFLSQLLREAFASKPQRERRQPKTQRRKMPTKKSQSKQVPDVIATDDGSWDILSVAPVEDLGVMDAIEKYTKDESLQVIVLCSWMPVGADWTALFRDHNVCEYILIGEYDDGNCGDNWRTWGNIDYRFDDPQSLVVDQEDSGMPMIPAYEAEGYSRVELEDLANFHFSRLDSSVSNNSKTSSFRRRRIL